MICSCSGSAGHAYQGIEHSFEAWAKATNAAGGLSGHSVEVLNKDDASTPGTAVTAAQNLITQKVVAILDLSQVGPAWSDVVVKAGVPILSGPQTAFHTEDFFPVGQTQGASIIDSYIQTAKVAGAKNIGDFYCAEVAVCKQSNDGLKAIGATQGLPLVYSAAVSLTATSFTTQCLAAKAARVESLVLSSTPQGTLTAAADCDRQGFKPIYVILGVQLNATLLKATGLKDNTWSPYANLPFFLADNPEITKLNGALDKYYPGLRNDPEAGSQDFVLVWAAGVLLQHAIQAANLGATDTLTAVQLKTALGTIKDDTLGGLSSPLSYPTGKDHEVNCWFTGHVSDGTPSVGNGEKPTCAS